MSSPNQAVPGASTTPFPAQEVARRVEGLLRNVEEGREQAVAEGVLDLMGSWSLGVLPVTSVEELEERRLLHEAVDRSLRGCLLAQGSACEFWKTLLLPLGVNVLNHGNLISNAKWMRRSGSQVPDLNEELLEPAVLAAHDLAGQAQMLGRFIVANDGARLVDYTAVAEVLDPLLVPAWTDWSIGCHSQSPDAICAREVRANQERTLEDLLEYWKDKPMELASTPVALATAYERPYRTEGSTAPVANKVLGELAARLFWNIGPVEVKGHEQYPEFELLYNSELLVFCPNWREQHVIHRCMSPLLEPSRRRDGSRLLLLHEAGMVQPGQCASAWREQALELELQASGHYLYNMGQAAEELKNCSIDLMYFPELCPQNPSAWFAMQRVARVQATGYGFPSTSGSPHMDYFIGGADVEGDGSDYVEQLVLIPGWGQALVEPPLSERPRQRPERDDQVQLASVATSQKLNSDLLRAWNEILRDERGVNLQIFPSLRDPGAQLLAPRLRPYFQHGSVELNGWTPRMELMDTLVQSDFYLDTFPYGGYNCLIEALCCGLPIVTIEGRRARNRNAAVLLRRLGLPEFLIASDYEGYITAAKRLIRDQGLRVELRERLADRQRVLECLSDAEAPAHFSAALDWMREQGPRNRRAPGPPVLIRAGEAPRVIA